MYWGCMLAKTNTMFILPTKRHNSKKNLNSRIVSCWNVGKSDFFCKFAHKNNNNNGRE